ncbi:MAG: hypothetical protein DME01_26800 [Candidatus Rokuibacteriota bacterium]|nr:MAG: hypothetical protein DME01_26800 [Candidatus Rokubacteria bacterium]
MMATACPRCGVPAVERDKCAQCGVVASVYTAALEKMRRPPTPSGPPTSAPAAPAPARDAAPQPVRPAPSGSAASATSVMTAAPAPTSAVAAGGSRQLTFHGSGGTLFGIYVVNILLTIVTFGFYRFWGRVKVRRFMLSQTAFEGDRFAYHGTGKELLLGFVKALLFVGMPITALSTAARLSGDVKIVIATQAFTYLLVFIFIPIAMVGARRYRLSRTSWRGIRFSFRGRAWAFVRIFMLATLLNSVTLTLYYPFFQARQQGFLVSNSYFGRRPFRFDGRGRDLFGAYVVALLLLVPTLGLYLFWFNARKTRYFWGHTYFETARFRSAMTGGALLVQTLVNAIMLILTLGLAWPWVLIRRARFEFACLSVEGPLDLAGIVQEPQLATATGDALSSLLGADVGFA